MERREETQKSTRMHATERGLKMLYISSPPDGEKFKWRRERHTQNTKAHASTEMCKKSEMSLVPS